MQTMHTKGVTMCTFTPVTENKIIRNNFLYNNNNNNNIILWFPHLHIFLNKNLNIKIKHGCIIN